MIDRMQDANGNYVPARPGPVVTQLPTSVSPSVTIPGNGPPEGVIPGVPGWKYEDISTGLIYLKMSGSDVRGWKQVGQIGQAGLQVIG